MKVVGGMGSLGSPRISYDAGEKGVCNRTRSLGLC